MSGSLMWGWIFFYTKLKLFDRLFPGTARFFLDGRGHMRPAIARTRKCHLIVTLPNGELMNCIATDCKAWRFRGHYLSWRRALTERRGACATSDFRRR